jgi:hypothetical protein
MAATIVGPELARWCTGEEHDDEDVVVVTVLPVCKDDGDVVECSVKCVLGRFELVYDECLDGDDVVDDAGDGGRNIAGIFKIIAIRIAN